jgi:osmotically inducible protein OsmC
MADLKRKAQAEWVGNLREGQGAISTESGVLRSEHYSFGTRFEQKPGTNPEELIAGAHAACYSMAFSLTLSEKGYKPRSIATEATCFLTKKDDGFAITKMVLDVKGDVPDLDEATFKEIAEEADKGCPVSNLLREGLTIELHAELK